MTLSNALARAGLTQSELARQLGVDRRVVSRWVTGGASPSPEHLAGLREILGAELDVELRPPGRPRKIRQSAYVRSRSLGLDRRRVDILTRSGHVLASGEEAGNLGDVLPILREQLERWGVLDPDAELLDWSDR